MKYVINLLDKFISFYTIRIPHGCLWQAMSLVSTMGDRYIGEYFTYIKTWGNRFVHLLPRIVHDKMVLEEVPYQIVIEGIHQLCYSLKRKAQPKFPIGVGNLSINTSTHANLLGKKITTLKLEESPKRMHDLRGFSAVHFSQAHLNSHYEHQNEPDDSIYN